MRCHRIRLMELFSSASADEHEVEASRRNVAKHVCLVRGPSQTFSSEHSVLVASPPHVRLSENVVFDRVSCQHNPKSETPSDMWRIGGKQHCSASQRTSGVVPMRAGMGCCWYLRANDAKEPGLFPHFAGAVERVPKRGNVRVSRNCMKKWKHPAVLTCVIWKSLFSPAFRFGAIKCAHHPPR